MNTFNISPSNYHIWNKDALIKFLVQHQGDDIVLTVQDEGCDCEKIGLYDLLDSFNFKSVTIITANSLEKHNQYQIKFSPTRFKFFQISNTEYTTYHRWNQKYKFGIFYNRPLWHRVGLAGYMRQNYSSDTLINFRSNPMDIDTRNLFELTELFTHHPESVYNFVSNINSFPCTLEEQDGYTKNATTKMHTDQLVDFYPNLLIDIVAETFTSGQTFFVTEKTVRPMLLKKPMIAMSSRDHLLYLRQLGFKTFYNFWDEDYDGYEGRERYLRILKLIDWLAKKNLVELESMYQDMQPILEHNYQLLATQSYSTQITQVF